MGRGRRSRGVQRANQPHLPRIGKPPASISHIIQHFQLVAHISKIGTKIGNFLCEKVILCRYYKHLKQHKIGKPMTGLFETLDRIEACLSEDLPMPITDLVAGLSSSATGLGDRLHARTRADLAGLILFPRLFPAA
jgi:hypothetical protein